MRNFYRTVRAFLVRFELFARALSIRASYALTLNRIRHRKPDEKIHVLFLVNEIAKWKAQSLYDLMAKSDAYEPMIGITRFDFDNWLSDEERRRKVARTREFYESHGMKTVLMFDENRKRILRPAEVKADVVFYQQPYVVFEDQMPQHVRFSSLTCYIPYYVTNYGDRYFDYSYQFHRDLWRYFTVNEDYARNYRRCWDVFRYAGRLMGLGHTGLDYYYLHKDVKPTGKMVIYAPHWSFRYPGNDNPQNYSTFLLTGKPILEYAKRHPEIQWVFRPHPSLFFALRRSGAWSEEEVSAYWAEWEKVGTLSSGGDYQHLLVESSAMITDCGSFLPEYFSTGKPLIHLIAPNVPWKPIPAAKKIFDTFYKVKSQDELESVFDRILVRGEDTGRDERLRVLRETGMSDNYAAQNILNYLNKIFHVR